MDNRRRVVLIGIVCLFGGAIATLSATERLPRPLPPAINGIPELPQSTRSEPIIFDHETPPLIRGPEAVPIPHELPGVNIPGILVPRLSTANREAFDEAMRALYTPLPPLGENPTARHGPDEKPLSLEYLQSVALARNPLLLQVRADVASAHGTVLQSGLWKNPVVGFQGDAIGQNNTSGRLGGFVSQEIIWAAKLRLARAIATADRELAACASAQMEAEVLAATRHGYVSVLAAHEAMRVQEAFAHFTDDVYRSQLDQARVGAIGPYDPIPVRATAFRGRALLAQARNRYVSAWKQLAAVVGEPNLPLTLLQGVIDQPMPILQYDALHRRATSEHSDLRAAQIMVERAQKSIRLAEANRVPNVVVNAALQRDAVFDPHRTTMNLQVGVPVPLFDRNQGNIHKARGELDRACAEADRVRNQLAAQLAEAFERYDNQRRLVFYQRDHILPGLASAYRELSQQRKLNPDKVRVGEIVSAHQNLADALAGYTGALRETWSAIVDLGKITQTPSLAALANESGSVRAASLADLASSEDAWPNPMPSSSVAMRALPDLPKLTAPPCSCDGPPDVRRGPMPLSDSIHLCPVGPLEKSTKRWRLFSPRRPNESLPQMLPQIDERGPSCPPVVPSLPRQLPSVEPPLPGVGVDVDPRGIVPALRLTLPRE